MGCADSKVEATGAELVLQQAEARLQLRGIDVKAAFSLLRRYSNETEIRETQLTRITERLGLHSLRPRCSFFLSAGTYSLHKLAMLFLMLSSSSLASKLQVFLLLWDPRCNGFISQDNISKAAELILAISVDFPFFLVKNSSSPFKEYKEQLQALRQLPAARLNLEEVLGRQKEVTNLTEEILGEVLDPGNVRKRVKSLQVPKVDKKQSMILESGPGNAEKRPKKGLSANEIAQRRLIREELQPKLDKGYYS